MVRWLWTWTVIVEGWGDASSGEAAGSISLLQGVEGSLGWEWIPGRSGGRVTKKIILSQRSETRRRLLFCFPVQLEFNYCKVMLCHVLCVLPHSIPSIFFYPVQRFGHRLLLITNHCLNLLFPLKGSMSEGFNFHTLLKTATKTNGYLQKRGHPITANVINFHYKIWRPLVRKKGTKRKKFTELEHVHTYIIFFGMWLFCQK